MLKRSFLFLLCSCSALLATAQDTAHRHEVMLGNGLAPFHRMHEHMFRGSDTHVRSTGVVSLTYRYHLSRVISIGLVAAMDQERLQSYYMGPNGPHDFPVFTSYAYTIAPEVTILYTGDNKKDLFRFYSAISMGATYRVNKSEGKIVIDEFDHAQTKFQVQVAPIGVRVGKALSGFMEIGMGYKGLLNYGVTYRF